MVGPPSYANAKRRPFFCSLKGEVKYMVETKEIIGLAIFIALFGGPFLGAVWISRKKPSKEKGTTPMQAQRNSSHK
jgi:hypothetical protein